MRLHTIEKRRAGVAPTLGDQENRLFQFGQGTAFIEQPVYAGVEQRLQHGRVTQHGDHNERAPGVMAFQIAHQREAIRELPIGHRIVANHQIAGGALQMPKQFIGVASLGNNRETCSRQHHLHASQHNGVVVGENDANRRH